MDDFSSLGMGLGLKPQGKAAPMSRPSIFASSNGGDRSMLFDDVFGGPPKYTAGESTSSFSDFDYNNKNSQNHNSYRNYSNSSSSNIFNGLGISASSRVSYDENNYATMSNNKENTNSSVDKSPSSRVNYDENVYYNVDKSASSRVGYDDNVFGTLLNEKENRNYNVDKSASYRVSYNENVFSKMSNGKENGNYGVDKSASSKVSYGENVFATKSSDRENRNYSVDESSSSKFSYDENVFVTMLNGNLNRNKSVEELGSSRVSYDENVFATVSNGNLDQDHSFDELDSSRVSYKENIFATMENDKRENDSVELDELLENLGRNERVESSSNNGVEGIDDLLPGFGVTSPQRSSRAESEFSRSKQMSINSTNPTSSVTDDPFVVFESTSPPENQSPNGFPDPLDEISNLGNSTKKTDKNSSNGDVKFDDTDPLAGFGKSASVSSVINKEGSPSRAGLSYYSDDNFQELHETIFEMPSISTDSSKIDDSMASPSYVNVEFNERDSHAEIASDSDVHIDSADDAWLRVYEIPLFTQPTSAPPPSRPPPSVPGRPSKSETESYYSNARTDKIEFYSQSSTVKSNMASPVDELPVDELENFAMGGTKHIHSSEKVDTNSSTCSAAMKEATDIAEARLRQTKEVTEREYANTARNGENAQVKNNEPEKENSENEERLESERRQREEEECMKLERERERAREERENARQAVERATREARERAAIEARKKSEREVVLRVQAEARRRAAEIAKEKAEKEAKERADAEIREKAAANARAEAEARRIAERSAVDRAAAEARERAANAARINQQNNENVRMNQQNNENVRINQRSNENVRMSQQQRNENDLKSFFSTNSRPSSAPKPMNAAVDPIFQSRVGSEPDNRTSSFNTTSNMRNTSSATNLFGDLSSIFGGTVSSGNFQEVDGETEERRRTRLDRHQQTQERVAKALAEKNERDLQSERDQEERHKIAEKLDKGIRDWASGKEGNLRAFLSTMQYVLWPECGWTPVSLTDLITGASVKKVYRKATLCIHPDKVQQIGANLQQKYIAEKVFNLLKEAWNKFNSEELF